MQGFNRRGVAAAAQVWAVHATDCSMAWPGACGVMRCMRSLPSNRLSSSLSTSCDGCAGLGTGFIAATADDRV